LAGVEPRLALGAPSHEVAAPLLVLAVQVRDEADRLRREDAVVEVRLLGRELDPGNGEVVAFHGDLLNRRRLSARNAAVSAGRRTAHPRWTRAARWSTTCRPGSPASRRRSSRCRPRAGA